MMILVCFKVTFYFLMATITTVLAYLVVVERFFFFVISRVILKSLSFFNGSGNGDSCLLENYFLFF